MKGNCRAAGLGDDRDADFCEMIKKQTERMDSLTAKLHAVSLKWTKVDGNYLNAVERFANGFRIANISADKFRLFVQMFRYPAAVNLLDAPTL